MLKIAKAEDIPAIVDMTIRFLSYVDYHNMPTDPDKVRAVVENIVTSDPEKNIIILSMDGDKIAGMIAAVTQEALFHDAKIAVEIGWWVEPEYRRSTHNKQLLDAFEFWAKKLNCSHTQMSMMETENAEKIERVYQRRKYKRVERSYLKELI
jgi:GNAT superfamily N-acetyltransferase